MRHARSIKLAPREAPAAPAQPAGDAPGDGVVEIWTDGACKGNPGPGGWGAWLKYGAREKELFGGARDTTNNRMELQAVIEALASLKRRCRVVVHTDSQYVKGGITEWLPNWIRRGWRTADNKPVKNADLWRRLAEVAALHDVDWKWVKGHAGIEGNERADELANRGVDLALHGGEKR